MDSEPQVILVDDDDRQVGVMGKLAAHQQGLLHRAFSVFVIRDGVEPEVLLQQRAADKYHGGGLWTNTCCSHPLPGEDIIAAGERRLVEEMGLEFSLTKVGQFKYTAHFANGLIEHEFDHVLLARVADCEPVLNPIEVAAFAWCSLKDLPASIAADPTRYTPWLLPALELVTAHLKLTKE